MKVRLSFTLGDFIYYVKLTYNEALKDCATPSGHSNMYTKLRHRQ